MTDIDRNQMMGWVGHNLVDPDGEKIGKIDEIYLDEDTGQPEWLAVSTGMFGTKLSFVPIAGANSNGQDMVSKWTKAQVKDAPNAEADGQLSQDEEARLYQHYGMNYSEARSDSGLPSGGTGTTTRTTGTDTGRDDAMTRSEEEMRVAKTSVETGRVRLRKYVETEHVSETVPVTREEVRVEREPITEANRDEALDGPEITEAEHEIILHEEQVRAEKVVTPKERVRLGKDVVTDERTVEGEIRKERIEVEGAEEATRGNDRK